MLPRVEVYWLDAGTHPVNIEVEKAGSFATLFERRSMGYLVAEKVKATNKGCTLDVLQLAHTFDPQDPEDRESRPMCADITNIPHLWVQKIKYLDRPKRKKKEKESV